MIKLKHNINKIVTSAEIKYGLNVYEALMNEYNRAIPLNKNYVFMEMFDSFYRLSLERKIFLNIDLKLKLFEKFEEYKKKVQKGIQISLATIVDDVSCISNKCEGVFASKIFHTLYPDKPILDRLLAKACKIPIQNYTKNKTLDDRKAFYVNIYETRFESIFANFMKSAKGQDVIKEFNKVHSPRNINDTKIVDFVLWMDNKLD